MGTLDLSRILRTPDGVADDAILVVDGDGRIIFFNPRYVEMWGVPESVLASETDAAVLEYVQSKLVDPQGFVERVVHLYSSPEEEARDELALVDGRTVERYSGPLRNRDGSLYGRVWFFRDVTGQKAREEALRRQLDRLAAVYAMASAVEEAEDVESMTEEAFDTFERLLGADRVALLLADADGPLRFVAWRGLSDEYRAAIEARTPDLPHIGNPAAVSAPDVETDPSFHEFREVVRREGLRAYAFIPLSYQGRLIGRLVAYFHEPRQLTEDELQLAQTLARHLSLAVARRRAEDALRVSRDELAAILGGVTDGITVQNPSGDLVYANESAARLLRVGSAEELVAMPLGRAMERFEVLAEDGAPFPSERFPGRRVLAGEPGDEMVIRWRYRDTGEERWSVVSATPVLGDDGEARLAINIFRDITERRRSEERVAFLAEAGDVLNRSLDYGATLAQVARLAVPRIADWCIVYRLEEDGAIRRLAVEDHAGLADEIKEVLERFELDPHAGEGVPAVLRSGEPLLQPEVTTEDIAGDVREPAELARATESLGIRSAMTVPLMARGSVLGAISFYASESGRRFGESDLELAQELARRASTAIDNALLFAEAQESFALLETLLATAPVGLGFWDRDLRFVRVNDALAALNGLSPEEHVGRPLREVVPHLADQLEPLYRQVLESGAPYVHLEQTTADLPLEAGKERHWLSSYYPVRTAAGEVVGLGAVIVEITERKRAEEERARLLEAEQAARSAAQQALEELKFQTTLLELQSEASPDGLLVVDTEGRIISINRRFAEMWHMPADVATGGTDDAALEVAMQQVEDPERFLAGVQDVYARPRATREELQMRDGRVFERHGAPVRGGDGTYYGFLWSFRDITERHRADLRLRLLAQSSEILSSSLEQEDNVQRVVRLALPAFADSCNVYVRDGADLVRIACAHADPEKQPLVESLPDRYPVAGDSILARTFRSNETRVLDIDDRFVDNAVTAGGVTPGAVEAVGNRSVVLVPLAPRDRAFGMIAFASSRPGRYEDDDVAFARELARRIAVRLENARLHRSEEEARTRLSFLSDASRSLFGSLDYEETLERLTGLVVPQLADVASVFLEERGVLVRAALAFENDEWKAALDRIPDRYELSGAGGGVAAELFERGEPLLVADAESWIDRASIESADADALRDLGVKSFMFVPLVARDRLLGFVNLLSREPGRYEPEDLELAQELARRAAIALENARLFHEAADRAQAARVLEAVGDGVFLVDSAGVLRLWNPAAEQVTGLLREDVVGRPAVEAIPGWSRARDLVPVADWPQAAAMRAETVPLDVGARELWLSISGVGFADGTVYAFRDLTEERTVEQLKSDFVSTVSHELRTPLAAIYGAALTLGRSELQLEQEQQRRLLEVIVGEADRLARTVNDILWASRLDSGQLHVAIESCDAAPLVESVVAAQRTHLPDDVDLVFAPPEGLPEVRADSDKLRQVLTNLLDNAVKYSPDGGRVELGIERIESRMRFWVRDQGLGIPPSEQERIFEKFYRLDPQLTRGVGGTGLGLYICRELVRRMEGRIWVYSLAGEGSTFFVELPLVERPSA